MRAGILMSVLVHVILVAAVALPHHRQTAHGETISVDLVPSSQAPPLTGQMTLDTSAPESAQKPQSEPPKPEASKPEASKPDLQNLSASSVGVARQLPVPQLQPQQASPAPAHPMAQPAQRTEIPLPAPPQGETRQAEQPRLEDNPAEQAVRIAALMNLSSPLSESSTTKRDSGSEDEEPYIAAFKAHLRKCWSPLAGTDQQHVKGIIRIALRENGTLVAEPEPIAIEGAGSPQAPELVLGTKRALKQCQPYTMLPADQFRQWRALDIHVTPSTLSIGMVNAPRKSALR
jgi:hypothetical protein